MAVPSIALALAAQSAGGFTYQLSTGKQVSSGFAVSPYKGHEVRITSKVLTPDAIDAYVRDKMPALQVANLLHNDGACIGAWRHDGSWYLDISVVVPSLDDAIRLARENNQLAVYSLDDQREIAVTP